MFFGVAQKVIWNMTKQVIESFVKVTVYRRAAPEEVYIIKITGFFMSTV